MEWAPNAKGMTIFGDFNGWNRDQYRCRKNEFGCFEITLKACSDGTPLIKHKTRYKLQIEGPDGKKIDKNSAWAKWQT
jgi:1,4-alpha-glucan branching enzyme